MLAFIALPGFFSRQSQAVAFTQTKVCGSRGQNSMLVAGIGQYTATITTCAANVASIYPYLGKRTALLRA